MAFISRSPQALLALLSLSLAAAGRAEAAGAGGAAGRASGAGAAGHAARPAKPSGAIKIDSKSVSVDLLTHQTVWRGNVVLTQGDLRVTADRAESQGPGFANSRCTFTGSVRISSQLQGNLYSDSATIDFRDNKMQDAVATGAPAQFEQTSSTTGALARGHADSIVYTVAAETIRLTDDAWVEYGNKITGLYQTSAPVLVYNIKLQRLEAASAADRGQRVHITVLPKASAPGQNAPAASAPGKGVGRQGTPNPGAAGRGTPQKGVEPGKQP